MIKQTHKSLEDLTKLTPLLPHDPAIYPPAETKRDREKVHTLTPDEFERECAFLAQGNVGLMRARTEHKVELVKEFVQRAKEVEVLIDVMPSPEDGEAIVRPLSPRPSAIQPSSLSDPPGSTLKPHHDLGRTPGSTASERTSSPQTPPTAPPSPKPVRPPPIAALARPPCDAKPG